MEEIELENPAGRVTVPKESAEWTVTETLARGLTLWDGEIFKPGSKQRKSMTYGRDVAISRIFVGYCSKDLAPVFACPARSNTRTDDHHRGDNFRGTEFRTAGNTITGSKTILHHGLSLPGAMTKIKALLMNSWTAGGIVRTTFRGSQLEADHDLSDENLTSITGQMCDDLQNGLPPKVFAHTAPCTPAQQAKIPVDQLDTRPRPDSPEGPLNRTWREQMPQVREYLWTTPTDESPSGFLYYIPYVSNMVFPSDLYELLEAFARKYPQDILNAKAMLFAVQLWADIFEAPDHLIETHSQVGVPQVPLAIFVVYFHHCLKVHELLRCIEYAHPCRIIAQMYRTDTAKDAIKYAIRPEDINEDDVRKYLKLVRPIRPELPVSERAPYFPFFANGTTMTAPTDLEGFRIPGNAEQAMIGLPSLQILGHPSMHRQQGGSRIIAMPKCIADLSYHPISVPLTGPNRLATGFMDPAADGITSLFGQERCYGAVWDHEFQPKGDNNAALRLTDRTLGPPELPIGLMDVPLSHDYKKRLLQGARQRLAHIKKHAGDHTISDLQYDVQGRLRFNGMPEEDEDALYRALSQEELFGPSTTRAPSPTRNVPEALVATITQKLRDRPKLIHVAWKQALQKIEALPQTNTPETLIEILENAKDQHQTDYQGIQDFVFHLQQFDDTGTHAGIRTWVPQFLCRLVGVEAAFTHIDWEWENTLEPALVAHDEDIYIKIDFIKRYTLRAWEAGEDIVFGTDRQRTTETGTWTSNRDPLAERRYCQERLLSGLRAIHFSEAEQPQAFMAEEITALKRLE